MRRDPSILFPMGPARITRIGVIGDIHAEDDVLTGVVRFLADEKVDSILAVGDIVDGPGDVDRCCRVLAEHGVAAVRGNHDRWFLDGQMRDLPHATAAMAAESRAFLAALPRTIAFDTIAGRLLLSHGLGEDDMAAVRPGDEGYALESNSALGLLLRARTFDLVVAGHTHERMVRTFGGLTIINAGTLYREHEPCVLVADLASRTVWFHDVAGDGKVTGSRAVSF
jgi:putative phosphoesterase